MFPSAESAGSNAGEKEIALQGNCTDRDGLGKNDVGSKRDLCHCNTGVSHRSFLRPSKDKSFLITGPTNLRFMIAKPPKHVVLLSWPFCQNERHDVD